MTIDGLRIALFSGNYNMTVDGANKALNRLVEYLLRQGAQVRVYSPTVRHPAFEPQGALVSLPSIAIPGRACTPDGRGAVEDGGGERPEQTGQHPVILSPVVRRPRLPRRGM